MRTDQTAPFRVGVTADVRAAADSFALGPRGLRLLVVPGVVWESVGHDACEATPRPARGADALPHVSPVVSEASLEGADRPAEVPADIVRRLVLAEARVMENLNRFERSHM
jgi:hypothetical protein